MRSNGAFGTSGGQEGKASVDHPRHFSQFYGSYWSAFRPALLLRRKKNIQRRILDWGCEVHTHGSVPPNTGSSNNRLSVSNYYSGCCIPAI